MNVYDFDGTLLLGDSEVYFIKYIFSNKELLKKYPRVRKYKLLSYTYLYIKFIKKYDYNYRLNKRYAFLKEINKDDINGIIKSFWDEHMKYIMPWYKDLHKSDDVVTSATPRFLLEEIIKRLKIKYLIASEFDLDTLSLKSDFNYSTGKVESFKKCFKDIIPEKFYSDSDSDLPMAKFACRAYKVIGDTIIDWEINR